MSARQRLAGALTATGLDHAARALLGGRGAILMFHRVREVPDNCFGTRDASIPPARFRALLSGLNRRGWDFVSLDEARRRAREGGRRFVCLTFDDGYRDNIDLALPIARDFGAPITIFVTTGFVDRTAVAWWHGLEAVLAGNDRVEAVIADRELSLATTTIAEKRTAYGHLAAAFMAASQDDLETAVARLERRYRVSFTDVTDQAVAYWSDLNRAVRDPLVELGAHTLRHPVLARLDGQSAAQEIGGSRQRLQDRLGVGIRHFAYPYGDPASTGRREAELCRLAGFAGAVTTVQGLLGFQTADGQRLPRLPVGYDDDDVRIALRLSGLGVALKQLRAPRRDRCDFAVAGILP